MILTHAQCSVCGGTAPTRDRHYPPTWLRVQVGHPPTPYDRAITPRYVPGIDAMVCSASCTLEAVRRYLDSQAEREYQARHQEVAP